MSDVNRWHSHPDPRLRNSGDTILQHQKRVDRYCFDLAQWLEFTKNLPLSRATNFYDAAAHHDEAERVIGDLPYSARSRFPDLAEAYDKAHAKVMAEMGFDFDLTPQEQAMIDLCDRLDAYCWAYQHGCGQDPEWRDAREKLVSMAGDIGAESWLVMVFDEADRC